MEVWRYWLQLWGILPTDEMQRLRAENELLRVQLEMAKAREAILKGQPPSITLPLKVYDPFNFLKEGNEK